MANHQLTAAERDTLNAAIAIILDHTTKGASWQIYPQNYDGNPGADVTYFDSDRIGHHNLRRAGCDFADMVQMAFDAEVSDEARAKAKQAQIALLQQQIAELTGEAA